MPTKSTVKAILLIIGVPISILVLYFGNSPQNVDSRGGSIKLIVLLATVIIMPLLARSYFKDRVQPASRSILIGVVIGFTLIIIPLTVLLRSLAYSLQNDYLTCSRNSASSMEQQCRDRSKLYFDGLYLNAGLEPGLVAFIMFYTLTMVAFIGRKKLR